ncbi:MAG TPA: hypothetical protein VD971_05980 [Phycisphaerales bacterium]|nr:hypothetical protein [Phycisphaerales bacterium]
MPTATHIQLLLQSISSLAIAGGLIFTALQFRRYLRASDVANFTKMVELQMHLREMRVREPSLAYVYEDDVRGMRDDRDIKEYFFNLMQLSVYEIVWYSYRNGQLPRDYFESWSRRMRVIAAEPSFRRMMESPSMKIMHDGFQVYIRNLMHEAELHARPGESSAR